MKKLTKIVPFFLAILLFSSVAPHFANAEELEGTEESTETVYSETEVIDGVFKSSSLEILEAIENIPYEELEKGPEATKEWFDKNTTLLVTLNENNDLIFNTPPVFTTYGAVACASAIGLALAGNVFSFTKITKIKWAIDKLGGVSKAASEITKWYDKYRLGGHSRTSAMYKAMDKASEGLGGEVKSALLDFFGITTVIAACFE